MIQLYTYARQRLVATGFQRETFLDMLLKRMLKSISRSSGHRVGDNKWAILIDAIVVSDVVAFGSLPDDISGRLYKYKRTHPQSCLRITFLMDYIKRDRLTEFGVNVVPMITEYLPQFADQGQEEWVLGVAQKHGIHQQQCGHLEKSDYRRIIQGNATDYSHQETCCSRCAETLRNSGARVTDAYDHLILTQFAVSVFVSGQTTQIYDSRRSSVVYDARRQIYHDINWSPYQGLIDNYHSSRNKGFNVIESPWFKSNRRAFGCELEVEVKTGQPTAAAGRVHELLNPGGQVGEYCYFERDGSIGEGFELITQPAGLDVHREKFALFLTNSEIKKGMRSHEGGRCGFHVHVGREYVTQSQIYRVQSFLNDVRNEALIRSIARRYSGGYCRIKHEMAKFTPHNKNTGERYEALNVQNPKTIEFRIFRGSLRYESIMAALEFCNAVLAFCTPGVTAIQDFTSIGFKKFVMQRENRSDTKFLRSYLALDADHDNERQAA